MKHRLAPLLEGMEMGKSEHDWLEQRLESMTAKEELLFRGAMQIESPRDIQTTIKILQGLDHYQLLYGAEDDVLLGRFVMEHIHTPTHAARGYLDPEIVGAAYREHGSGSFVENHYVERLNPDRPLPEVNPNVPLPITGEYAIRVKLVSRNNMEGVWIGFPDTGEYMDTAHPDELLLGLDALQAETLDQCMAVDVDCVLPQITDILNQYDSAGELVRHAIDFGYVWAEQGQGEPHWMENGSASWNWKTVTVWIWHWISLKTSTVTNLFPEGLILPSMAWTWPERRVYLARIRCSSNALTRWPMPSITWQNMACPRQTMAMQPGMSKRSYTNTASQNMNRR